MITTEPVYRPKPLEWERVGGRYRAIILDGYLEISMYCAKDCKQRWALWRARSSTPIADNLLTRDAAEAFAESWHRDRLLGGLEEVVR